MRFSAHAKAFSILAAGLFLIASAFTHFSAQDADPSPDQTVTPSPSPSASPTPTPTPLPGAQNFHRWGSITLFNGLPSDAVRAISQTPDGVMWFGTDNGLARFDGRRVQRIPLGDVNADRVLALEATQAGLWIGTTSGAYDYDLTTNQLSLIGNTKDVAITTIYSGGELLLGTGDGFILHFRSGAPGPSIAEKMFPDPIRAADGKPLGISSLVEHEGKLLAGTAGGGIFVVSDDGVSEFRSAPRPLFVNSLDSLERTETGKLWLGTDAPKNFSGIYSVENGSRISRVTAPTANVRALETNEGGVWAGTDRAGLFHVADSKPPKNYTFENTSGGLRSDTIYTLFTDREGVLWIGTNRGVSRFDRLGPLQQTVSDVPNSNFIRTLFRAADGKIYAGSNRGLFIQKGEEWTSVADYLNKPIYSLGENRAGRLIVGTTEKIDPSPSDFKMGTIRQTFKGMDGDDWLAAEHGVFRIRDGQPERIIDAEDVRDVFVRDGRVWAATTTRGLVHARNHERFGWIVSSIGFEQGLPSEKAFSILPMDDGLLIATNRGVVTYKPGTIAPKLIPTRVLSQRVHDLAELRSTIELDYPQNSLLLEVAGLSSRTFPEEFQYAFVLTDAKGSEIDKRLSNDPQYAPANLAPGEYVIESLAFNRDLLSSEPLMIRFSVAAAPFPWTATALGVLLAIALVALIWAVVERRRIAIRNRELTAARFDLATEAERERRRIARDLHDQTLADLRSLMMKGDKLFPPGEGLREEVESISTEVRRICEDLSPSVLENVGLVPALEFLLGRTVENHRFESSGDAAEMPINVQLQIYRIAQEVLTNIERHAQATLVEMTVRSSKAEGFEMSIVNDGIPFSPDAENSHRGRGIGGIRSRASLIHAAIAWHHQPDDRTRFTMRIAPRD